MPADPSPLHAVLAAALDQGCRVLDLFLCRACGLDPLQLPCKAKAWRKLQLYHQEASPTERLYVVRCFPELMSTLPVSVGSGVREAAEEMCEYSGPTLKISQSPMWARQNSYYEQEQMHAWSQVVPFEISSNMLAASQYCDFIEANSALHLDRLEKNGAVAVAKELRRRNNLKFNFKVICTDFHSGSFHQLLSLPWVLELCREGLLDFAVLRADRDETSPPDQLVPLLYSGVDMRTTKPDLVILVANYAFDSFPVDLLVKSADGTAHFEIGTVKRPADSSQGRKRKRARTAAADDSALASSADGLEADVVNPLMTNKNITCGAQTSSAGYCCSVAQAGDLIADAVVTCDDYLPGAYVVPVAGFSMMKMVRAIFGAVHDFSMIVGDYFLCPDSKSWQLHKFEGMSHAVNGDDTACTSILCPWFDPPLISPSADVCAWPVTLDTLLLAFRLAFCGGNPSFSTDLKSYREFSSNNCETSTLFPSSFGVLFMSANPIRSGVHVETTASLERVIPPSFSAMQFGPNELSHVRQLFKEDKNFVKSLSVTQWETCILISCFDVNFFVEHMWTIRKKLIEGDCLDSVLGCWVEIGARCFINHSYFTSIGEFCVIREKVASWLVSLNCLEGYTTVRSLYLRSSYSFLSRENHTNGSYWLLSLQDVLLCHRALLRVGACAKKSGPVPLLQSLVSECMPHLTMEALLNVDMETLYTLDTFISAHKCMKHWLSSISSRKKVVVHSFKKTRRVCGKGGDKTVGGTV